EKRQFATDAQNYFEIVLADAVLNPALSGFFMEKVQLLFATCRSSVMLAYFEGGCYGYFAERNFVGISSPLVWRAGI
ncbi:MAG: hypothetical protein ACLS9L_01390, partial [Alphaproteobacteria bacterium]